MNIHIQERPSISMVLSSILVLFLTVTGVNTCSLPKSAENIIRGVELEDLTNHPSRYFHRFIEIRKVQVVQSSYFFNSGIYRISALGLEKEVIVYSSKFPSPNEWLQNQIYYVQPILCSGEEGCMILLKELNKK